MPRTSRTPLPLGCIFTMTYAIMVPTSIVMTADVIDRKKLFLMASRAILDSKSTYLKLFRVMLASFMGTPYAFRKPTPKMVKSGRITVTIRNTKQTASSGAFQPRSLISIGLMLLPLIMS